MKLSTEGTLMTYQILTWLWDTLMFSLEMLKCWKYFLALLGLKFVREIPNSEAWTLVFISCRTLCHRPFVYCSNIICCHAQWCSWPISQSHGGGNLLKFKSSLGMGKKGTWNVDITTTLGRTPGFTDDGPKKLCWCHGSQWADWLEAVPWGPLY